ncbi:hypothetical protein [Parvularcula sp. LCG005]|uniref:hypothetical protein n=1 Tax=Parvularcula sp. LCG005 TaxID=3078805 RepID=UPI002942B78F|nr:hypothetical protein [Parvularcula sp. LCG005]WOI52054.1 hypothetical protein RUI03_07775 [Parvularcula sp. LCG005]
MPRVHMPKAERERRRHLREYEHTRRRAARASYCQLQSALNRFIEAEQRRR